MSNVITLTKTKHGWIAEYTGPHSSKILKLFGTAVLPTPFTDRALPTVVKREIEHLNPDCEVLLAR